VVATVELHDLVATGETARESHRAHQRFGARRDQSNLFEAGDARGHRFGEQDLARRRRAECRALATASRSAFTTSGARDRGVTRRRTGRSRGSARRRRLRRRRHCLERPCRACRPPSETSAPVSRRRPAGHVGPGEPRLIQRGQRASSVAISRAKYVKTKSAPARRTAVNCSRATAGRRSNPWRRRPSPWRTRH